MTALLSGMWLLTLVVAHLVLRSGHVHLGPEPTEQMILFFGLNLPTMLLAAGLGLQNRGRLPACLRSPVFIVGMILIMANFMSAAPTPENTLEQLLTVLTAQALWLAWPVYWMLSHDTR